VPGSLCSFGKVYVANWHETLVAVKVLLDVEKVQQQTPEVVWSLSDPILQNMQKASERGRQAGAGSKGVQCTWLGARGCGGVEHLPGGAALFWQAVKSPAGGVVLAQRQEGGRASWHVSLSTWHQLLPMPTRCILPPCASALQECALMAALRVGGGL